MKKSVLLLLGLIFAITVILIILGFIFNKSENEKQQGLTEIFDVSSNGTIAYVVYEQGQAGIYLTDGYENPVLQLSTDQAIVDLAFSADDTKLAYVVMDKNIEEDAKSVVNLLSLPTFEEETLFSKNAVITELAFDPKDSELLFYLQADTFENYSPIAQKRPHDFDLYSYLLTDHEHVQYTDLAKYSMSSLQVSPNDKFAFIQMDDDTHAKTADDIFDSKQRVFQIPLDNPEQMKVISNPNNQDSVYDFLILPNRNEMIYQAVSKTGQDGIYEYELFRYNWDTDEEEQLTMLKESASKPVRGPNDQVFFIVDRNFGKRHSDFHLYRMDVNGKNLKEIPLDVGSN